MRYDVRRNLGAAVGNKSKLVLFEASHMGTVHMLYKRLLVIETYWIMSCSNAMPFQSVLVSHVSEPVTSGREYLIRLVACIK